MAANAITEDQKELILSLARNGQGRNAIAAHVGVSGSTVSKICHEAGHLFDAKATEMATKVRRVELSARRAQLELDYLTDAQKLRTLIWQPAIYRELGRFQKTFPEGAGGRQWSEFVEYEQPTPIPADQERLMRASVQASTQSQRIADSASDENIEAAKSMLAGLQESLAGAWRTLQQGTP